jgi:hypothetical protein
MESLLSSRLTVYSMLAGFGVVFYRLVTFATLAVAHLTYGKPAGLSA